MGIRGRLAKDAVNCNGQHSGATAFERRSSKPHQNTPAPDRNAFNRQPIIFKSLVSIAPKVRLLRDERAKLCCPLDWPGGASAGDRAAKMMIPQCTVLCTIWAFAAS
jgi:hypothetical protein